MTESQLSETALDGAQADGADLDSSGLDGSVLDQPGLDQPRLVESGAAEAETLLVHPVPDEEAVVAAIRDAVTSTPGVLRLEPTLSTVLQRLGRAGTDGLLVSNHGSVLDVEINVSTSSNHQARRTAIALRSRVSEVILGQGLVPGTLEISVLAIDEPTAI